MLRPCAGWTLSPCLTKEEILKPSHEQLVTNLAQCSKERDLLRIALSFFMSGSLARALPDIIEVYGENERFRFHIIDLDKPHGGIVAYLHSVTQTDHSVTQNARVQYLDDMRAELKRTANSQWRVSLSHLIEKADRLQLANGAKSA